MHWRQPGCHAQAQWSEAKREVQSVHAETQRVVDETLDAEQSVQELRAHFSAALDEHSHVKTTLRSTESARAQTAFPLKCHATMAKC